MTDPRVRRAALIRDQVLMQLEQGPTTARLLLHMVRHSVFGLVTEGHIDSALAALRTEGRVRYHERRWELCS